mmetsp:Transcript_5967/g.8775  ORF Transcript_5967/g.8775 Transcript_5967/m.8775 type:complete len:201 (-) Transcript_5967:1056-1658(-)
MGQQREMLSQSSRKVFTSGALLDGNKCLCKQYNPYTPTIDFRSSLLSSSVSMPWQYFSDNRSTRFLIISCNTTVDSIPSVELSNKRPRSKFCSIATINDRDDKRVKSSCIIMHSNLINCCFDGPPFALSHSIGSSRERVSGGTNSLCWTLTTSTGEAVYFEFPSLVISFPATTDLYRSQASNNSALFATTESMLMRIFKS